VGIVKESKFPGVGCGMKSTCQKYVGPKCHAKKRLSKNGKRASVQAYAVQAAFSFEAFIALMEQHNIVGFAIQG
jgi:hypothetical protein